MGVCSLNENVKYRCQSNNPRHTEGFVKIKISAARGPSIDEMTTKDIV